MLMKDQSTESLRDRLHAITYAPGAATIPTFPGEKQSLRDEIREREVDAVMGRAKKESEES